MYDEESVAKETDRARQLRIDELALPTTESRLLTQIQDLQKKSEFLDRCKIIFLRILRQRAVLERPTSPANSFVYSECQNSVLSRFWIAA